MDREKSIKDILSGLIFVVLGGAFGLAATGYEFGTALRITDVALASTPCQSLRPRASWASVNVPIG